MCFPIDIDVARDVHVQRTRTLETRNRLALREAGPRPTAARRGRRGLALTDQ